MVKVKIFGTFSQGIFIKNIGSSTSYKKNSVCLREFKKIILLAHSYLSKPNPSPYAFPKLREHFSARFPLKGRETVPSFALWIWKRNTNFYIRLSMILCLCVISLPLRNKWIKRDSP